MADKKPLRLSDDANDLQSVEFGASDSLGISDGGTSAITANDALNNLLPSQTGNAGKHLETDGANTSWVEPPQGGGGKVKFGSNSATSSGKWLELHRNVTSNEVPYVAPDSETILALSAFIKVSSTITFGIYKNGSQIDTLVLTAVDKNYKSGLTHALVAGDEISVKVESGSAQDPILFIHE